MATATAAAPVVSESPRRQNRYRRQYNNSARTENREKPNSQQHDPLKVFVSGFPPFTTPDDIKHVFSSHGLVEISVFTPKFAIAAFADSDKAKEAVIQSHKVCIHGKLLKVKHFGPGVQRKRDFIMSKMKNKIIDPREISLTGDFYQQLDNILSAVRLSQDEVTALSCLYQDLQTALSTIWPGCQAKPFGSITSGLGITTSDADCFVELPQEYRIENGNYVNRAKKVLWQYPQKFAEILSIPNANTPIVKFYHIPTKTNCDVSFKTPLGFQNSKLIAFLLETDARLIPIAVAIKYWAKVHELSGTGRLTNYALAMLIIFYMQHELAVLPSVESLQRDPATHVIIDNWNTGFTRDRSSFPNPNCSLTSYELIGGFFDYYAKFNFGELVVCPYLGYPIKRSMFKDLAQVPNELERYKANVSNKIVMPIKYQTSVCIQDPFELSHNVASGIGRNLAGQIKAHFDLAAAAYHKQKEFQCENYLKTVLLFKPKLQSAKTDFRVKLHNGVLQRIKNPDWRSVVSEITLNMFEQICKVKLTKLKDEPKKNKTKYEKQEDTYRGAITKAIWKRKQFTKLNDTMERGFLQKQIQIIQEIINTDKDVYNVKLQLRIVYTQVPKTALFIINLLDGDNSAFQDFGKLFIKMIRGWFMEIIKPHLKWEESSSSAEVKRDDVANDESLEDIIVAAQSDDGD